MICVVKPLRLFQPQFHQCSMSVLALEDVRNVPQAIVALQTRSAVGALFINKKISECNHS